jgi:hypothetical protein
MLMLMRCDIFAAVTGEGPFADDRTRHLSSSHPVVVGGGEGGSE